MQGITGDGEKLKTSSRGGAGGQAEQGGNGGRWRLDRVEGNNTLSMQMCVLSKSSDERSEGTNKKFKQSMVQSRNSDEEFKMGWDRVG